MNVLEFDSLYLSFAGRNVLSSVHMVCRTGRIVALLGRNGSGKSCLMKIVFGTLTAEFKSVRYNGVPLTNSHTEQVVAYLPQDHFVPPFLTFSNAASWFGVEERKLELAFEDWRSMKECRVDEVSTGQRRMLEVLLVLHGKHPFCILDEPFSGLAPVQVEWLMSELDEARKTKGIILTDHLHRQVRSIADDLYVLVNGQTRKVFEPEQLIEFGYVSEI